MIDKFSVELASYTTGSNAMPMISFIAWWSVTKFYNRVAPAPNSNAKPSTLTVVMRRIFFLGGERNTVLLRASPGVQGVCGFFAPLGKY